VAPECWELDRGTWIIPTITLAAALAAAVARFTRSAMLEVLSQDYLRTARAQGITERIVVLKHAFRNVLIPVITVLGLQITALVVGSVVIETVFAWPGIGELFVTSVIGRDYPVVQCGVVLIASLVVVNLAIDLLYGIIDPRIRKVDDYTVRVSTERPNPLFEILLAV
jgi:ABC-type dipeptide/oligopeptide/nickel transport system permease component